MSLIKSSQKFETSNQQTRQIPTTGKDTRMVIHLFQMSLLDCDIWLSVHSSICVRQTSLKWVARLFPHRQSPSLSKCTNITSLSAISCRKGLRSRFASRIKLLSIHQVFEFTRSGSTRLSKSSFV